MCPLPLPFPGGSTGQVWSGRGDPTGCAQRDGHHVLVAAPGYTGKLCPGNPVLHSKKCPRHAYTIFYMLYTIYLMCKTHIDKPIDRTEEFVNKC